MLVESTLIDGEIDKVAVAIQRIKEHEPPEGYYVAFSGGKDSSVVLDLVKKAGVKYDAHYNVTTLDPPELVYFIKKYHPDAWENREKAQKTMWQLIEENYVPPTRIMRYCCRWLKESKGLGRTVVTGVRAKESRNRAKRKYYEPAGKNGKAYLNPIIDWSEAEVWEYIHKYNVPYCKLYDEGYKRIGCIMCPFSNRRHEDEKRYPKYAENYRRACIRGFNRAVKNGVPRKQWKDGNEMYEWWVNETHTKKNDEKVMDLFSVGDTKK